MNEKAHIIEVDSKTGERFYKPSDVAELVGVTSRTITEWISAGSIGAVNVGKSEEHPRFRVPHRALAQARHLAGHRA